MNTHELIDFYCDDTERGREIVDDIAAAYAEGYEHGKRDAVVHGRWKHLYGDEWCCSHCGFVISTEGSWEKPTKKYCEECGCKMDAQKGEAE